MAKLSVRNNFLRAQAVTRQEGTDNLCHRPPVTIMYYLASMSGNIEFFRRENLDVDCTTIFRSQIVR